MRYRTNVRFSISLHPSFIDILFAMDKLHKKRNLIAGCSIGALILLVVIFYLSRNAILHHIVNKRTVAIEQQYGLSIRYNELTMNGLSEVVLQRLSVVPHHCDTLLTLQTLNVRLSLPRLLRGHLAIRNVSVDNLHASFIKENGASNYDFLFRKAKPDEPATSGKTNYAQRVGETLELLYGFLPENGELNRLCITDRNDSNFLSISIPALAIKDNRFCSDISIKEDSLTQHWVINGALNRATQTLKADIHAHEGRKVILPYITHRFGAELTFDTLAYSLTKTEESSDKFTLQGEAQVSGLHVYHPALSPEAINLNRGQVFYRINLGEKFIELDSATNIRFNKMEFHPYLRAEKKEKQWHFTASVNKPWFPADDLFGSLPQGLFGNLEGIKTRGELSYHFLLDVDFALPDSLKLESELKERDFHITQYGRTNLEKMSKEFVYTAYEDGKPVRSFSVGPSWEHFAPLDSISPYLQMSVMQSEDGAFYHHQGFLPKAMREALIHDLKVKRFARGGSTITMQLVKNVFLNRNKNMARKLEEALIVWLIETEKLTSKERMYEVYLNIAEWGPLIYGAHEAAAYYFNKRPSQLTVEESIFLASIVPKPKHFRHSFTEDMKLKENLAGYYRLIAERLEKKGLISPSARDSVRPHIEVTGTARRDFSLSKDSMNKVLEERRDKIVP